MMSQIAGFGAHLPKLPQLDKDDVKAVRSSCRANCSDARLRCYR